MFIPFEKFLNGVYVKYNNNAGFVLPLEKLSVTFEWNKQCQAFSHYTFSFSKGELIVMDLQGVNNELIIGGFYLTDPAI